MKEPEVVDEWYEVQYSHKGADQWYRHNLEIDTLGTARTRLEEARAKVSLGDFDWRMVKKTVTEEVVE